MSAERSVRVSRVAAAVEHTWASAPLIGPVLIHLQIAKTSFLRRSYYRFELLFDAVKAIVVVLVLTAIWREIYAERSEIAGYSLQEITVYTCAAITLALLFNVDLARYLSEKIRTGTIALDFIKPLNINLYHLSDTLGGVCYAAVLSVVPTFALLAALFGISGIFSRESLAAVPLALLGFLVHYVFCYLLALTTFFTVEAWGIEFLRINLVRFFAGGFLPIAFFPESLRQVSQLLPFEYMIFPAASVIAGTFPADQLVATLAMQAMWCAILLVATTGCWTAASRKVTVHGG